MNPVVFLVLGGAACAAALVAGFALLPDDPIAVFGVLAGATAFHSCMILLDLRSTAVFGVTAVARNERSVLYRRLAGKMGLAAGGACMWAIDYALVWVALPVMVSGAATTAATAWPDMRATGMFLLVFGAIHAFGWLSNRRLRSTASGRGKDYDGDGDVASRRRSRQRQDPPDWFIEGGM